MKRTFFQPLRFVLRIVHSIPYVWENKLKQINSNLKYHINMKSIHLILSIIVTLFTGACDEQQEPYYGDSYVKMPQIDSAWNLELMPNQDNIGKCSFTKI